MRFRLNVRKNFSTTRTIKRRNRHPGEVVPCEPYGMEKISWLICLGGAGAWTEPLEVTSTLDNPVILRSWFCPQNCFHTCSRLRIMKLQSSAVIRSCQRHEFSGQLLKCNRQDSNSVCRSDAFYQGQPVREKEIEEIMLVFFLSAIIHVLGAAKCIEPLCKQLRALNVPLCIKQGACITLIGWKLASSFQHWLGKRITVTEIAALKNCFMVQQFFVVILFQPRNTKISCPLLFVLIFLVLQSLQSRK